MARPKKLSSDEMLQIVDAFFKTNGNPSLLKCSLLEEYAISIGVDVKAYDFRRDPAVRKRIDELRDLSMLQSKSGAIAYKNLDVDALLSRCRTKTMLRNSLLEMDETWRRIYERAVDMSKRNDELKAMVNKASAEQEQLASETVGLSEQIKLLKKDNKDKTFENRYLRRMLKTYLYPAIAHQILLNENVLDQVDTEITPLAMEKLVDPATPASFSGAVAADRTMLSREESLLSRMREQIFGGHDDE